VRPADLDEAVLPRLAAPLQALLRMGRAWWTAVRAPGGWRRLPGPLPVLATAVLLSAVAALPVVSARSGGSAGALSCLPSSASPTIVVGPVPRQPVAAYLAQARCRIDGLSRRQPGAVVVALVDLRGYQTPHRLAAILRAARSGRTGRVGPPGRQPGRLRLAAAWVRYRDGSVPTPATEYRVGTVGALAAQLVSAGRKAAAQAAFLASELTGGPGAGRAGGRGRGPSAGLRRELAVLLRAARADARGLAAGCRCVFAVVVRGPAAALRRLAAQPAVRAVDPAPPFVALPRIVTVPLLPEVFGFQRPLDGGFGGLTTQ
jgi:hypothetical protein